MNKKDLIDKIVEVTGNKKNADDVLNCLIASIKNAICKKEDVFIKSFGSFKTVERKARKGRNPQTGEKIIISARSAIKFTPAKALKEALK